MVTSENDDTEQIYEDERTEKIAKMFKIGKISILIMLTIFWIVSAVLGLISLGQGESITDTPWVIMGLVLLVAVIFLVVIPLFRNLRADVKDFNKEKAEKEKLETEMVETQQAQMIDE